jgi:hypothetical protein
MGGGTSIMKIRSRDKREGVGFAAIENIYLELRVIDENKAIAFFSFDNCFSWFN